jgi:hypothetical protein
MQFQESTHALDSTKKKEKKIKDIIKAEALTKYIGSWNPRM